MSELSGQPVVVPNIDAAGAQPPTADLERLIDYIRERFVVRDEERPPACDPPP